MTAPADASLVDSPQAWRRLLVTLVLMTVGASGTRGPRLRLIGSRYSVRHTRTPCFPPFSLMRVVTAKSACTSLRCTDAA